MADKYGNMLFRVDTGEPDAGSGWHSYSSSNKQYFVIAKDYNEAAEKVMFFIRNVAGSKAMFDGDGSIRNLDNLPIKAINLVTDKLIF